MLLFSSVRRTSGEFAIEYYTKLIKLDIEHHSCVDTGQWYLPRLDNFFITIGDRVFTVFIKKLLNQLSFHKNIPYFGIILIKAL